MSKMYKRYLELKQKNSSNIYLFKSGIFYVFLQDDAKLMCNILNLRLTNLNENVLKCGFPVNNLNKYLDLIKSLGYEIYIVDSLVDDAIPTKNYLLNSSIKGLINKMSSIDVDSLSIKEAYSLIGSLKLEAIKIKQEAESQLPIT